jgi:hypothetical protein
VKTKNGVAFIAFATLMGGCASSPQQPVQLNEHVLDAQSGRLGVAMTKLPKADTQLKGADCLLCIAAASAANYSLTSHAYTLPTEDLGKLKEDVAERVRKKGLAVTVVAEDLDLKALEDYGPNGTNIAKKDFSTLKQKYNIDKLVVIDITAVGFLRTYSSYIPTSDPKAMLQGAGYIVNLNSNSYEWYLPVSITKSADGNWKEPPHYPGLTNAYFQAVEMGRDAFIEPFDTSSEFAPEAKR